MSTSYFPYKEIPDLLQINAGDVLLLFADIKKIAFMAKRKESEFNINKFVDAILDKLGPNGTLLIPTYNYNLKPNESFDVKNTKPITGILALETLKRSDFSRTANPLHSFAVSGSARDYLKNLSSISSFGNDSPFHFLYERKAKMLMLDLDLQSSFTFAHYVEQKENVWYRYPKQYPIIYTDENGITEKRIFSIHKKYSFVTLNFHPLEDIIKPAELQNRIINNCNFRIIDLYKVYDIVRDDIRINRARRISRISPIIFIKENVKDILQKLNLYTSVKEKIYRAPVL